MRPKKWGLWLVYGAVGGLWKTAVAALDVLIGRLIFWVVVALGLVAFFALTLVLSVVLRSAGVSDQAIAAVAGGIVLVTPWALFLKYWLG